MIIGEQSHTIVWPKIVTDNAQATDIIAYNQIFGLGSYAADEVKYM